MEKLSRVCPDCGYSDIEYRRSHKGKLGAHCPKCKGWYGVIKPNTMEKKMRKLLPDLEELSENKPDVIHVNVPLFIRLLEYAKEDAKTDMDLHFVAENLINICQDGTVANMDLYEQITTVEKTE